MLDATHLADPLLPALNAAAAGVRVGIDIASVPAIEESLASFGERFTERLFTAQERADALAVQGEGAQAERLAARFAAKEAVIKALDLPQAGIGWRDIELTRGPGGRPALALHGRAAELAQGLGVRDWAVSISHDGPQACAVVVALLDGPPKSFPSTLSPE
ncbi:MAG TPA: holo-ACP synthase [Ideonella sp.]|jgi:holo-[acyl-carrier protein] synthase|nr:holo-ACP synthase [Ideonella sp.]